MTLEREAAATVASLQAKASAVALVEFPAVAAVKVYPSTMTVTPVDAVEIVPFRAIPI